MTKLTKQGVLDLNGPQKNQRTEDRPGGCWAGREHRWHTYVDDWYFTRHTVCDVCGKTKSRRR